MLDRGSLITIGMISKELERLSGHDLDISSRDDTWFCARVAETGAETVWIMPPEALELSLDDMERRYLRAVANEIQRNWRG